MRYFKLFILTISAITPSVFATEPFYSELNKAQRFDLANAYVEVADTFEKLDQAERAENYRELSKQIFSGSEISVSPSEIETEKMATADEVKRVEAVYSESMQASSYYFEKLIRALNEENLSLTLSVLASKLYIPGYERGIEMSVISKEVEKLFNRYNLQSVMPGSVFHLDNKTVKRIPNNTWRLSVPVKTPYQEIFAPPFQGEMARFYFRRLPMGWRLIALDTANIGM